MTSLTITARHSQPTCSTTMLVSVTTVTVTGSYVDHQHGTETSSIPSNTYNWMIPYTQLNNTSTSCSKRRCLIICVICITSRTTVTAQLSRPSHCYMASIYQTGSWWLPQPHLPWRRWYGAGRASGQPTQRLCDVMRRVVATCRRVTFMNAPRGTELRLMFSSVTPPQTLPHSVTATVLIPIIFDISVLC